MKTQIKKLLCAVLSAAMVAGTVVLPTVASAEDMKSWKFDFGAADSTPEAGYILVSPDINYSTNTGGGYGFIGTNEMDYALDGGHIDGFAQQEGQVIQLQAGGGTGLNDGIGSVGEDLLNNPGDKYYPVRFAVKVPDETYYKVKATVTTLDTSKPAKASLYTERKHPLYTEKEITAGETVVTEFTVRPTPIYYKGPGTSKKDEMVNVCVLGENTALASLEITQLETAPVLWVLGDSTVTDGGGSLPFFPLQNYTGVGTGLTKYLPSDIAMVNEGEGGLNATDTGHFNMAKDRIKAGDYMYVEYGHNHKNANNEDKMTATNRKDYHSGDYWLNNYLQALKKYYEACKTPAGNAGANLTGTATLIIVGPIDRHNTSQYNSETNVWSSTLNGFSEIGKRYVDCLLYAGEETAASFLNKWNEISAKAEQIYEVHKDNKLGVTNNADADALGTELTALKAEADTIYNNAVAGEKNGVENVAFVDLNQPSLDWLTELTKETKSVASTDYYFQTAKGGKVDGTHPNDTGAENLAYFFFTTADTVKYPAITPLLANFEEGVQHEMPTPVSAEIIAAGPSGKTDAWPTYQPPVAFEYPLAIKDIELDNTNHLKTMKVVKQAAFSNYAAGIADIYNADGEKLRQVVTSTHVDNTNSNGTYTIEFDTSDANTVLADGESYKAYMWSKDMTDGHIIPEADGGEQLSSIYTATDIDTYLLPGDKTDVETFNYYGKTSLDEVEKYSAGGSAGRDFTLGTDSNGVTYTRISSSGAANGTGGSFCLVRSLENLEGGTGYNGRYMIDVDLKYTSGGGADFVFAKTKKTSGGSLVSPFLEDTVTAFTVADDGVIKIGNSEAGSVSMSQWTNVKYILDMDLGKASVSVAGGTPVEVDVPAYASETIPNISTLNYFAISASKVAFDINASNMTVAKLKDSKLPEYTLTVAANNNAGGTVKAQAGAETGFELSYAGNNAVVKADAANKTATLIEVKRKADGTLESAKATALTFTDELTKTVPVTEGSSLMLWDKTDGLKPLAPSITADASAAQTTVKAVRTSTVTVKANANDGYVFMGWLDKGGKTVSTDAVYTFRLLEDRELTANFVKEPSVTDIKDYELVADKSAVKAVAGTVVNVDVRNAKDEAGTPINIVKNSDAAWSCNETGVKVENGVVTLGDDFSMDGAEVKTVTIKTTLNGIDKTCSIVVSVYDYYENFDGGDLAKTDWFVNKDSNGNAVITEGKLVMNANGSQNKTYVGVHFAAPADAVDKNVTIKFDYKTNLVSNESNKQSGLFLVNLGLNENTPTYSDASKGVSFNTNVVGLTADTEYEVVITINNKTKEASLTATPKTGEAITYTIEGLNNVVNTIFFRPGKTITDTIDNFRVTMTKVE